MEGLKILTKIADWIYPKFKFLESALISLILIGISLKILQLDFGKNILMISLHILSTLYFINSFAHEHVPKNDGFAGFINRLLGITYSILFIGIIFTINQYQGSELMLKISTGTLFVLIPGSAYLWNKNKGLREFYRPIIIKSAIYSIIGLLLILTPVETIHNFGIG